MAPPSLSTRLVNIKNMNLPFCKRSNHFDSQVNDLDMTTLNPVCCVCRHDDIPDRSVVPLQTILSNLSRQLDQQTVSQYEKTDNMEPRFLEIERDFKSLALLCDQLSQDVRMSLDNYRKTISRDIDKDPVGKIIDDITASDNQADIRQGFNELQEYTYNDGTQLVLNRRKTESFSAEVDQNADVYINTMNEIIRRLQDILGEMSEWSLIRSTDGSGGNINGGAPVNNNPQPINNSGYGNPVGRNQETAYSQPARTLQGSPSRQVDCYQKIEDYDIDAMTPQLLRGTVDHLSNKIINIDLSSKIGKREDLDILNQFLTKVANEADGVKGIKLDMRSWNCGDKYLKQILSGISNIAENNNDMNVLVLKFIDWNDCSDVSLQALNDTLRTFSRTNQNIELFCLNLECWHNCSEQGVQGLSQSIKSFVSANRSLQAFSLNMRHWKTCGDDAVVALSSVISSLATNCRKLAHFNLNLYDWSMCTDTAASAIAKNLVVLGQSIQNQLKTFVLELAYWKEATDYGANQIARAISSIVRGNFTITNFIANFYNWSIQNKEQLNQLRQELAKNSNYNNFQFAY